MSRLSRSSEGGVDLGGQEIVIELVRLLGIERMKSESFPPRPGGLAEGGHDNGSACRLLVELDGRRKDVQRQRGPDAETGVATIDGKPAE